MHPLFHYILYPAIIPQSPAISVKWNVHHRHCSRHVDVESMIRGLQKSKCTVVDRCYLWLLVPLCHTERGLTGPHWWLRWYELPLLKPLDGTQTQKGSVSWLHGWKRSVDTVCLTLHQTHLILKGEGCDVTNHINNLNQVIYMYS